MKRTKLGVISLILVSIWASSPFIGEAKEQKGLVGYWKFDEGSGKKAIDSSDHENHGMITGKPKWVKGQFGEALELDGATFVEVQDSASLDIFDKLTMQAWPLTTWDVSFSAQSIETWRHGRQRQHDLAPYRRSIAPTAHT